MIALSRLRRALLGAGLLPVIAATIGLAASASPAPLGTLGFAIVSFKTAGRETPYLEECPGGVAIGNDEIWWKSLSPRDRDRLTDGGEKEPSARRGMATLRGPQGEDVCWNPTVVQDPPMRVVESSRALGFNLEGTTTGEPTAKSCRHRKFIGTDGVARVDNQMWRLVGCIHGWRGNGYIENTADTERRNSSQGVTLIRISGVQTLEDSPAVTVRFYRAADVMPKDSAGNILPYASYRIDGNPRYGATAKGRIRHGVLTTEPLDVRLPYFGNRVETEFLIRDLRLELSLTEIGAKGLIGGYHDLENWWSYVRRMGYLVETAQFSCPALHAAAHELADGYPDPQTGDCTALSVAYSVEAVRAFVNLSPKPTVTPIGSAPQSLVTSALPPGLRVSRVRGSEVVTTAAGRTLYVLQAGDAACRGDCARPFVPLRAAWGAIAVGAWQTRAMADGTRQWIHGTQPVFACERDAVPGDVACAHEGWQPLTIKPAPALPSSVTIQPSEMGPILADRDGRSLYRLLGSRAEFEREICDRSCMAAQWRPARVGASDAWAFRGTPLYTFRGDTGPGQIAGHRFGGASVSAKNWFSVITVEDALGPAPTLDSKE